MTSLLESERARFLANPDDSRAFEMLEERLFVAGEWDAVVEVCTRRAGAASLADRGSERAQLHFRIGQVHEDQRADLDRAVAAYQEALRADSRLRQALVRLRKLHMGREEWTTALQIAEIETGLPLHADERARVLAEMGSIWLEHLGDTAEALVLFERALHDHPNQAEALEGSGRALEALGEHARAAAAWDRAIRVRRGPQRAAALVARARLCGVVGSDEQAGELYRRALTDDPNNPDAIEAVAADAEAREQWTLLADLQERRFELVAEAALRFELALQAGRLQLEKLSNPAAARMWFERAESLDPAHPALPGALADLARAQGDRQALLTHLERAVRSATAPAVETLLELARLQLDLGSAERAHELLAAAYRRTPDDAGVAEALSEVLGQLGRDEALVELLEHRATLAGADLELRARVLAALGTTYEERLGDGPAACVAFRRAFEADPSVPGAAAAIERLFRKAEDWESVREFLQYAGTAAAPSARVGHLCSLAAVLGDHFDAPTEAKAALEAVLELEPDSVAAHRGLQALAATAGDDAALARAYEREAKATADHARLIVLVRQLVPRLAARGEIDAALGWAARWIEVEPEEPEALVAAADLNERLGNEEALVACLSRLDPLLPSSSRAANRRRQGHAHARAGRAGDAIAAFQSALEIDPEDVGVLAALVRHLEAERRLPELAEARAILAELLPPAERAACLEELARLHAERLGDPSSAIEILVRLSGDAEASAAVGPRLSELLERAGRYEELAEQLMARARTLDPDGDAAQSIRLKRGRVLLELLERFEDAASEFSQARLHDADCPEALEGLERALRASGDPACLAAFLRDRMEHSADPGLRERCAFERAGLLEDLAEGPDGVADAIELYDELAATAADDELRERAGERLESLYERTEDWEGLRNYLEGSLDEGADDPAGYERLGFLYRDRLRNLPKAVDRFEAATTIAPERADLWRVLADLYEREGRIDDLVTAMEAEIAAGAEPDRELTLRGRAAELCNGPLDDADRAHEHYERVLALDPAHSAAADFLIESWERRGDAREVVRLLLARLAALEDAAEERRDRPALRTSLRLRIAELYTDALDDASAAIDMLEPALAEVGAQPYLAEPLAALYERAERPDALIALCRRAAQVSPAGDERASWFARLGHALRRADRDREAADAYRSVLSERPGDRDAQAVLRDLYRRLDDREPLAGMLALELSHLAGAEEIPVRLELAGLLEPESSRHGEALLHLRRVLELDPTHAEALARALELAEAGHRALGDRPSGEMLLGLLDTSIAQAGSAPARARAIARRGELLEASFADRDGAISAYREALTIDPGSAEVLSALRQALEAKADWTGALDCIFRQASACEGAKRVALLQQAVEMAWRELGADATLPWLERLRRENPSDATVIARVADIHRRAGRHEATLRSLEAQAALIEDRDLLRDLHLERAAILEESLGCPGRALAALEDARQAAPSDAPVLRKLVASYERLQRHRAHAGALERLVGLVDDEERVSLLRELSTLYGVRLADPQRAASRLLAALAELTPGTPRHGELLRELGDSLRAAGDSNSWASCAEEELNHLPDEPVFLDRRSELHRELARAYECVLGRPDRALEHLRALADEPGGALAQPDGDASRSGLLRLLQVQGNWLEFEQRLAAHLARRPDDPEGWLALGRLREERLAAPSAAADAYRQVLQRTPDCLAAVRGLRAVAERLGRWEDVAAALESELEHALPEDAAEQSALRRRLGDVYWRRLQSTTRASRCYAAALEAHPADLESLRSLEQLLEAMEDWRGALDLYWSELEMLGSASPQRRHEVAIRAGEIARDKTRDLDRAVRAYVAAAEIFPLPAARTRELAALYEARGNGRSDLEAFVRTFEAWCEDPESGASCTDHLKLAEKLDELDRHELALERVERATRLDENHLPAWDLAALLREAAGDLDGAAEALSVGAELTHDGAACARLVRAAELVEAHLPERAAEWLRAALRRDPAAAHAHARLAVLAMRLEDYEEAKLAAGRALDLASEDGRLDAELKLAAALAGGEAALALESPEAAVRCFGAAASLAPHDAEALAQYGEALAQLGDLAEARRVLEERLALPDPNPDRARQLATIGRALWQDGESDEAVEHLESALREDPALDVAHECLVSLCEAEGRIEDGIACLERWSDVADEPSARGERLFRAAEWEIRAGGRTESAERHLREVLDADPSALPAWETLVSLLWADERGEAALQVASMALNGVIGATESRVLSLVAGRALEQLGERAEAAEAFLTAARADVGCVEAALSRARLLRGLGEWRAAADTLRDFAENHYGDDRAGLSEVLQQLGRLLAGPLEDADGAVDVYRRAIAMDPERLELHASLAEILSHRPECWQEAVAHHAWVLRAEPTHTSSLRVLARVAQERGSAQAIATAKGILGGLGIESPAESHSSRLGVAPVYASARELADPLWEQLRQVVCEAAREISTALDVPRAPREDDEVEATVAAFHARALAVEGALTAPALSPLTTRELAEVMSLVAALALEPEQVSGDGRMVNTLSSALKWRVRRRLRKLLEGADIRAVARVDVEAWRREVRALAQAIAIDETEVDLRSALLSVSDAAAATGDADLTPIVAAHPQARALLRQAVRSWLVQLSSES